MTQPDIDRHTDTDDRVQDAGRGWRGRAACRHVDPDLFFPTAESGPARDAQVQAAKTVCARCPVRAQCLNEALARIPYGICGGLTEHERHRLRRAPSTRSSTRDATSACVDAVVTDGPPPGMTPSERARIGRLLLAAGRTRRQVAVDFGVCPRTVQRWAEATTSTCSTSVSTRTSRSRTGASASGAGEGSRGGHRAPLQVFTAHDTQAGTRAPEGARA